MQNSSKSVAPLKVPLGTTNHLVSATAADNVFESCLLRKAIDISINQSRFLKWLK